MKTQATIIGIAIAALAMTPALAYAKGGPGQGGQPKDRAQVERGQRDMDRDRLHDRDRITNPQHDRKRDQLRLIGDDEQKRTQFMAQHREEMQKRAKAKGVKLEDDPDPTE